MIIKMFVVCIALQFVLFIPFFIIWKKDCKKIGKENLAVSLKERFAAWVIYFPMWLLPFLDILK
nr:MAG TPA: hypothetical protein [Caudoviricetes sp.]